MPALAAAVRWTAPDGADAATFLVAREVKPAELVAELARLDGLGANQWPG